MNPKAVLDIGAVRLYVINLSAHYKICFIYDIAINRKYLNNCCGAGLCHGEIKATFTLKPAR